MAPAKADLVPTKLPPTSTRFQEKFSKLSDIQKANICRIFPGVQEAYKEPIKVEQCQAEEDALLDDGDSGDELSDEEWSESETEELPA